MSLDALYPFLTVAAAGSAFAGTMLLRRAAAPQHKETYLADQIPWLRLDAQDQETIHIANGGAFRVVALDGAIYAGKRTEAIDLLRKQRLAWFLAQRHQPVTLRIISRRHQLAIPPPAYAGGLLGDLDHAWHKHLTNSWFTTHHLIFSVAKSEHIGRLDTAWSDTASLLSSFSPRRLTNVADPMAGGRSPLLSFLAGLINDIDIDVEPTGRIPEVLAFANMAFGTQQPTTVSDGFTTRHRAVLGVRAWPEYSTADIMAKLLQMPAAVTTMLHAVPLDPTTATRTTAYRAKQAELARHNPLIGVEWTNTKNEIAAEKEALYTTEFMVYLTAPTAEELGTVIEKARSLLGAKSIRVIDETLLAERAFWARLPGYEYFTRPYTLLASNMADLTPWESEPQGRRRCDWGDRPVRHIPTASSRTPYGLTFHISDGDQAPPHWAMYGTTGGGKTTIAEFLISGSLSNFPDLKAFAFDRDNGMRVFAEAIDDAQYLMPESDTLPLNPFDCLDQTDNRARIEQLIAMLADVDDDKSISDISDGVAEIMKMPRQDRILNKVWTLAFPTGPIRAGLKKWVSGDRYGRLFNGDKDAFNPTGARFTAIDMTAVQGDERLSAALTYYFMDRIQGAVVRDRPCPHLIFVDEAGTLLQDAHFAKIVESLLRTSRKNRGSIGLAFQEVTALTSTPIAQTILVNVATNIFWPGTAKREDDCIPFGLTESETAFVLGNVRVENARYPILLKSVNESVVLDADISAIGPLIKFFRGGAGPTQKMLAAIRNNGADKWKDAYLTS